MRITELKALAEAATQGPWYARDARRGCYSSHYAKWSGHEVDDTCFTITDDPEVDGWETDSGFPSYGLPREEAEYIAAANPAAILTLISALEKYEEALVGLRYGCGEPKCFCDVSIGNPMYRGHSDSCKRATDTLTQVQKIMEGK